MSADTQLIVSTHSTDFLQGLLDFAADRTSIIRLTREWVDGREINRVNNLNSDDIYNFWRDAQLKTSDVLTSLFHDVAIIVEGDSDARFLRAMIDLDEVLGDSQSLDLRIYHCGGKQKIFKITSALSAIGVPVIAIVDIDILDDETVFFKLFNSVGPECEEARRIFKKISNFVLEQKSIRNKGDAQTEVLEIFKGLDDRKPIPTSSSKKIMDAVQSASAWRLAKRSGEDFFTRGEPFNNFRAISKLAEDRGIFINRFGELENFDRTVEARKEEWLSEVFQKNLAQDKSLDAGRRFANKISQYTKKLTGKIDREIK